MERQTIPSRRMIAEHWIEWEKSNGSPPWTQSGWDWGEPSCMACGYWSESWDVKCRECRKGKKQVEPCTDEHMQSWNKAKGLQRCHVIPAALGGSYEPSNFVLMCADCHREAPDTIDSGYMFDWMKSRQLDRLPGIPMSLSSIFQLVSNATDAEDVAARLKSALGGVSTHLDAQTGARFSKGTESYLLAKITAATNEGE